MGICMALPRFLCLLSVHTGTVPRKKAWQGTGIIVCKRILSQGRWYGEARALAAPLGDMPSRFAAAVFYHGHPS
jgi:hypothetical protein